MKTQNPKKDEDKNPIGNELTGFLVESMYIHAIRYLNKLMHTLYIHTGKKAPIYKEIT